MHNFSLNTLFIGKPLIFLPMCHSTNEYAEKLVEDNKFFEGTTILTYHQTKGKGQRGNKWESEPQKNLTFSIIIKPRFIPIHNQFLLNIVSSLSILKVLSQYAKGFRVKWPNDIYWNDLKLGGILIENRLKIPQLETSIIGIGLNVNQHNFRGMKATSLVNIIGRESVLENLMNELLASFENYYLKLKSQGDHDLLAEYLENLYWRGEKHLFKSRSSFFMGEIKGIDSHGRLLVLIVEDLKTFDIKEIEFIE